MYWLFGQVIFSALRCKRPFGTIQVSSPELTAENAPKPRHKRRESVIAVRIPTDTIAYNIVKDVRNMRVLSNIQLEYITNEFSREQILSLLLVYNHVIENVNFYMETH
jgi:AICAR transformylase/IMP cyclohydrolase PurH